MRRIAQRAIRPLLFLSCLLFALSVVAPGMYTALTRRPFRMGNAFQPEAAPVERSVLVRPSTAAALAAQEQAAEEEVVFNWEPRAQELGKRPALLLSEALPPAVLVDVAPPVAELIALDPSLADSGELPSLAPARPMQKYVDPSLDEPPMTAEELNAPLPPPAIRKPTLVPPAALGAWPFPAMLLQQLRDLTEEFPDSTQWATDVIGQLDLLTTLDTLSDPRADEILLKLQELAAVARERSAREPASRERTLRLRAGYSLLRRVVIWERVAALSRSSQQPWNATIPRESLSRAMQQVQQQLLSLPSAQEWATYLKLNQLASMLSAGHTEPELAERRLARQVLARLDSPRLNQQQYDFLSTTTFAQFMEALIPVAQEPVDWRALLDKIERHEALERTENSVVLAEEIQILRWSLHEDARSLARLLNDNYRNANVRVAISEKLINRFLPPQSPLQEPVVDNIRGADVYGHSEAVSRLRVVLLPDRLRWRMGLEALGEVASATESVKGPARFWNDGLGRFEARKLITVDRRGMQSDRAHASASAENYLKDFETNFDGIPLFGNIARSIARQQYDREQPLARNEIESKISTKAEERLDREVAEKLVQAERNFQEKFLAPLEKLNLEPTPVQMETTEQRLICRYRMAGRHQLGSHTPRPQAPGDSLLSLQLHQSLFNNVLENLRLDDRRVELGELYVEMLQRFEARDVRIPEDLPENVTVHFAKTDAVRIACEDGRLKLTIRLQELNHNDENVWKNFEVHGYYVPSDNQQEANLVREGNLELSGARLRLADQVALRGIFAKVLSKNRTLSLVNRQLLLRQELADLDVAQFVIQDGWIGIALGPKGNEPSKAEPMTTGEENVARHPFRDLLQRLR